MLEHFANHHRTLRFTNIQPAKHEAERAVTIIYKHFSDCRVFEGNRTTRAYYSAHTTGMAEIVENQWCAFYYSNRVISAFAGTDSTTVAALHIKNRLFSQNRRRIFIIATQKQVTIRLFDIAIEQPDRQTEFFGLTKRPSQTQCQRCFAGAALATANNYF
jgi:hypothetical protein